MKRERQGFQLYYEYCLHFHKKVVLTHEIFYPLYAYNKNVATYSNLQGNPIGLNDLYDINYNLRVIFLKLF